MKYDVIYQSRNFLGAEGCVDNYNGYLIGHISGYYKGVRGSYGPDADLTIHDGKNTVQFYFTGDTEESRKNSLDALGTLVASANQLLQQLAKAYAENPVLEDKEDGRYDD